MPLSSGTITLVAIGNISGAYNMNADASRKLCGVSRTSGTSWSMSSAQGKAWVTSVTNGGYYTFTTVGSYPTYTLVGGGGVYPANVTMELRYGTIGIYDYVGLVYGILNDTGGGFTSQPYYAFEAKYELGVPIETAYIYGVLSGSG